MGRFERCRKLGGLQWSHEVSRNHFLPYHSRALLRCFFLMWVRLRSWMMIWKILYHFTLTRSNAYQFTSVSLVASVLDSAGLLLVIDKFPANWPRLKFYPVTDWDPNSKRATRVHFRGEIQCATSREFTEYKCEVPANMRVGDRPMLLSARLELVCRMMCFVLLQVAVKQGQELVVGFCSEDCTEFRSASCEFSRHSLAENPSHFPEGPAGAPTRTSTLTRRRGRPGGWARRLPSRHRLRGQAPVPSPLSVCPCARSGRFLPEGA